MLDIPPHDPSINAYGKKSLDKTSGESWFGRSWSTQNLLPLCTERQPCFWWNLFVRNNFFFPRDISWKFSSINYVMESMCLNLRKICIINTLELRSSGSWLSRSHIIRIGLALRLNLSRILKTNLPWNYLLSDQVQYSVMALRTLYIRRGLKV